MTTVTDVTINLNNIANTNSTRNALIISDCFITSGYDSDGFVSFRNGTLFIHINSDTKILITDDELWQIVKFALDNGLKLPQNEDEKE